MISGNLKICASFIKTLYYGSPRIHAELKANGETCSRNRVASLMKKNGIMAKMSKRFKVTTRQAAKPSFVAPDLIQQNFKAYEPNEAWVSDITYVLTQEGWVCDDFRFIF